MASGDAFDLNGFIGGVHAGHNWQDGNLVYGIEADLDYSGISGGTPFAYPGGVTGDISLATQWQGSVRLRGGVAADNLLFYVTGGLAVAEGKLTSQGNTYNSSDTKLHLGWTVGAGIEYAVTESWTVRTEARYTDFAAQTYKLAEGPVDAGWTQTSLTAGLSFKF